MTMVTKTFRLTEDHLKLLKAGYYSRSCCITEAPGLDEKRPFGNGSWREDVMGILGIDRHIDLGEGAGGEEDYDLVYSGDDYMNSTIEYMEECIDKLYNDLQYAMAIVLKCQTFETGVYEQIHWCDWRKVSD